MKQQLYDIKYNFINENDKEFITAFDEAIREFGYESGGSIGSGYCWGRYMIIYPKAGVKGKKVAARIYIRDDGIVLRLFLNEIDKHREYIENAPDFIRQPFIETHGNCNHCKSKKDGICRFRKTYTFENRLIEKCSGVTFEFHQPDLGKLLDYMALFKEFYPIRKSGKA